MAKIKVKLNEKEVGKLLKSEAVKNELKKHADETVQALGSGYEASTYIGKTRANASIAAVTYKAKLENSKNNTILKALR